MSAFLDLFVYVAQVGSFAVFAYGLALALRADVFTIRGLRLARLDAVAANARMRLHCA